MVDPNGTHYSVVSLTTFHRKLCRVFMDGPVDWHEWCVVYLGCALRDRLVRKQATRFSAWNFWCGKCGGGYFIYYGAFVSKVFGLAMDRPCVRVGIAVDARSFCCGCPESAELYWVEQRVLAPPFSPVKRPAGLAFQPVLLLCLW